jgi:hypothetical protein
MSHIDKKLPTINRVRPPRASIDTLLAVLISGIVSAIGWTDRSYDLQYHLFFASHYRTGWFEPWETRWYRGFLVFAYPPLVHQVLAAASVLIGLDGAGRLVLIGSSALLVLALCSLSRALGDRNTSRTAAVFFVGWSAPYVFLLDWGQITVVASVAFALFASAALLRYLRSGARTELALWALLAGCTAASQQETAILLLPALAVASTLTLLRAGPRDAGLIRSGERGAASVLFHRAAAAAIASAVAVVVAVGPFLWWLATQNLPQASIPHPSRGSFFTDPHLTSLYFTAMWGVLLLLAPLVMLTGRHRIPAPFVAIFVVAGILSIGLLTPLPKVLFPGWAGWLTYEVFGLYGAAVLVVLVSLRTGKLTRHGRRVLYAVGAIANSYLLVAVIIPSRLPPSNTGMVDGLAHFLGTGNRSDWYYATFELGDNRMARLSRLSNAPTIDGYLFMARTDPRLRASGIGTIDSAPTSPHGLPVVESILSDPVSWRVRWIATPDPGLTSLFERSGWSTVACVGPDIDFEGQLSCGRIWEAPEGERIPKVEGRVRPRPEVPVAFEMEWGIVPPSELVGAIVISVWSVFRRCGTLRRSISSDLDGARPTNEGDGVAHRNVM